ncbi:PRC-barrel domain-containing protein [Arcticibacter eurypsychrophilus]|uniref:PRC-barrel domain-containing protein n=1 Tax=Arcticibacter eurypsychrophilus TaxID=1434752 RepID=UPI00084DD51F|nr:PRC-barrel domain-containing protein [Arcticibacter eurypsychrophilus]
MKRSVKSLVGFTIGATDGEIGKVKEFYFDDKTWTIRYLIVDTGSWLSGRKVLISPEAVIMPNWELNTFFVNLTMDQVKQSPDIDTEKSVSRQHEIELYKHYTWGSYWGNMGLSGMASSFPISVEEEVQKDNEVPLNDTSDYDSNLRSTANIKGYNIKASDGEIGDVVDFIFDDSSWKLVFMVVDTGSWFPGRKVLISPEWVKEINWYTSTVTVNCTVDQVKNSPEYQPSEEISESYEANLQNYYGKVIDDKEDS